VQGNTGKTIVQKRLPKWAAGDSTAAELIAIEAALAYQTRRRPRPTKTVIATDSKQAIRRITEGTSPHGQYVVRYICKHIAALQAREGTTVTIQWVPAHKGVYGNEWADKRAKKALEEGQGLVEGAATQEPLCVASPTNPLTSLDLQTSTDLTTPTNPSTPLDSRDRSIAKSKTYQQRYTGVTKRMALRVAKKTLQKKLDESWKQARNARPRDTLHTGSYTWKLDGAHPGSHIATVYNAVAAEEASILAQCRTGHSRLKSDLYRMKLVDSAVRMRSHAGNHQPRHIRMPPPARGPANCHRGSRAQVEGPFLHIRGLESLGRPENWATSRRAEGKMEGEPPGGEDGPPLPSQVRQVCVADESFRVRGS
jgi:ribonuclease HI